MTTLDDLVNDVDVEELTYAKFLAERTSLAKQFFLKHGVSAAEIADFIRSHPPMDSLIEAWINLHAMEPFLTRDSRPPRRERPSAENEGPRERPSPFSAHATRPEDELTILPAA